MFLTEITYIQRLKTPRAKGWIMYGMDSKLKSGDQLKNFRTIKKKNEDL